MPDSTTALRDGELLAAVDLGSNSFHMIVARYSHGELRTVDRLREMVRMADGLDEGGGLAPGAMQRALDTLGRFGQRLRELPAHRVRAIATNTVRMLRRPQGFLVPAETALGHGIEVVAGREEARLVYLGVVQGQPHSDARRLVIDIGGGSTEFIIGEGLDTIERESLQMGCVATTRRFFGSGQLSRQRWKDALTEISAEFQQFATQYCDLGWADAVGSSGTIKSIGKVAQAMGAPQGPITAEALAMVRERLLQAQRIDAIDLPALSADRRAVIAGGLLVLEAAFNELDLRSLAVSKTSMREGVLYDMIGRASDRDPRDASIRALQQRYALDLAQATRVEETALALFDAVAADWALGSEDRRMLAWAARIHEVGLTIAHSQHHQHGAYLVAHSDIAGFTRNEQQVLAALVRCQRRSLAGEVIDALPERLITPTRRCVRLLRLAVLLHRSHDRSPLPPLQVEAGTARLRLALPGAWLEQHPLTRADLESEREQQARAGCTLQIQAR